MTENEHYIGAVLGMLQRCGLEEHHAALTALVAERAALKQRVAELEAHPPADRDRELREQLVVAVYPILLAVAWGRPSGNTTAEDMADTLAAMRELAIVEADKMIAAMRKEGGGA